MKKVIISLVILILGVSAGFFIFREICKKDSIHHEVSAVSQCVCGKSSLLSTELNLTDKQKEKLRNLDNEFDSNIKTICRNLCNKRVKLAELFKANKIYNKEIDICIEEILTYQARIEKETAKHIFDVKNELNKEQQEKFITLVYDKLCKGLNEHVH